MHFKSRRLLARKSLYINEEKIIRFQIYDFDLNKKRMKLVDERRFNFKTTFIGSCHLHSPVFPVYYKDSGLVEIISILNLHKPLKVLNILRSGYLTCEFVFNRYRVVKNVL